MVREWGKKLIQGAKEEIGKEPIQLLNTEKVLEWVEMAIPIGLLTLAILRGLKKPSQPTVIVINNIINGVKQ